MPDETTYPTCDPSCKPPDLTSRSAGPLKSCGCSAPTPAGGTRRLWTRRLGLLGLCGLCCALPFLMLGFGLISAASAAALTQRLEPVIMALIAAFALYVLADWALKRRKRSRPGC